MPTLAQYKKAVCLAALDPSCLKTAPLYLAISRRNDNTQWGLPGGKVDEGETSLQAIIRECKEELGIDLDPALLRPGYVGICEGKAAEDTYTVQTFVTTQQLFLDSLTPEEGMELTWLSPEQLHSGLTPFAKYNKEAFKDISQYLQFNKD